MQNISIIGEFALIKNLYTHALLDSPASTVRQVSALINLVEERMSKL